MDLIYADKNKNDVGVLKDYKYDLAYGSGENDFEITVTTDNHVCTEDYYIYIEDTEYGGVIDSVEVDTKNQTVKYKGRTFHGILDKKVISPDSGQDYYTVTGDMNVILGTLITRLNLSALFVVSTAVTKIITHKFSRYVPAYKGITRMLADNGYKLKMSFANGMVELSAIPVVHYDEDSGLDSDRMSFNIQRTYNPINHLICLGKGELKNRTVVHLYLDNNGNVVTTPYYTGVEEIAAVFDYSNAESVEELTAQGKKNLLDQDTSSIELTLGDDYEFDIGDIITVTDIITGTTVTRRIVKKIVTINNDILKINYSVGE